MGGSDASLIFDAGLDVQVTYKKMKGQLKQIVRGLEQEGVTKLKFDISPTSINNVTKRMSSNINAGMEQTVANISSRLSTYKETITKFSKITTKPDGGYNYNDIKATVNAMEKEVATFDSANASMATKKKSYENLIDLSRTYRDQLKNLNAQMRNTNTSYAELRKMTNLQTQVQSIWNKHGTEISLNKEVNEQFQKVQNKLKAEIGSETGYNNINEATQDVANLKNALADAGIYTDSLGVRLKKMFSLHFNTMLTMAAIHMLSQGLRDIVDNVEEVDSALTQLEIVTGESGQTLEKFADKAFKSANKIGASATDIMSSTETWARLGYNLDDSLSLAETTAKFANVGDISVDEATTSMTSILKAYNLDPSESGRIADILVDVGAKYAVSASELGEALQRGGASLEAANNTLEESIALITAGNAAVNNIAA